jgi:hypothetical protein
MTGFLLFMTLAWRRPRPVCGMGPCDARFARLRLRGSAIQSFATSE